jgi:hypothetical protein
MPHTYGVSYFSSKGSPRDKLDYGYGYAAAGRTV